MSLKRKFKERTVNLLEKAANRIAKNSTDSRCVMAYHQPKIPDSIHTLGKNNDK